MLLTVVPLQAYSHRQRESGDMSLLPLCPGVAPDEPLRGAVGPWQT